MLHVLIFVAVSVPGPAAPPPHDALERLYRDYWQTQLRHHPTRATALGDHRFDDRLDDYSEQTHDLWLAERKAFRAAFEHIDQSQLSDEDRLNATLFADTLRDEIELAEYPDRLMPLGPQSGIHLDLPMLLLSHPFRNEKDYENYLARLRAFPRQVDQVIALMNEGIQQGIVPPRVIMGKVLEQVGRQIVKDAQKSEFYKPTLKWPEGIDKAKQAFLTDRVDVVIRECVVPAYAKLHGYLRDTYLPKCRGTVGLGALPRGQEWYARLARFHTTTRLTPDEIHRLGMKELDRIEREMRQIAARVGFKGDLKEFEASLRERADLHARTGEELMKRHAEILKRSDALLPKVFGRLPKTPYEIKEMEAFRAPEAPMAYYQEAPDQGTRPAYFYVNTYKPTERALYVMEALAYHEAMPGHHLQIALAKENKSLPAFRGHAYVTAFVEGWGLYSESLGKELGGYRDPYSDFGRLTFDAWRSCRLVVDTGMHHLGWTRQQAIDFMKQHTSMTELDIVAEVDRYIAWPGQALAYKMGQLAILDVRRQAEEKLGKRFSLRDFHDELLGHGALPLDVMRQHMEAWIEKQAAASAPAR